MPASGSIVLKINGHEREAGAAPDTPLLYVLRNDFGLKGTRFGCGDGLCGACTVLLDGTPRTACDVPLWEADGKSILTIEGMDNNPVRAAIIAAMIDQQAGQCGYCLPGIVMRAQALLQETPRPTRAEIASALEGNLCRCGAHVGILRAIEQASVQLAQGAQ